MTRAYTAIDLFSGIGGMTQGLKDAGFTVLAAVDIDPVATSGYLLNHPSTHVFTQNIRSLAPATLLESVGLSVGELDLLAGCPPCQGFSTLRTKRKSLSSEDKRNSLIAQFGRYVDALRPKSVLLENVPNAGRTPEVSRLKRRLRKLGFSLNDGVIDAANYGVPQRRRRYVLMGTRMGNSPEFGEPLQKRVTVQEAIGKLAKPGVVRDPAHSHGEKRSERVVRVIQAIPKNGGSRADLPEHLRLDCHRRTDGFRDVYGRMCWDDTSPTITSGCINPSKGRFLHPVEDRAITVREAAILQSFPESYKLPMDNGKFKAAELIGNALPPRFIKYQASRIIECLEAS